MLGAIVGDIAGSPYEGSNMKDMGAPLFGPGSCFTDDSVLTIATAEVLLRGGDYAETYQRYGRRYPDAGYGGTFLRWIFSNNPVPYQSWGNGSGMRSSPIGWACGSIEEVLAEAKRSAAVTHNHPEGIKGAQAIASAVYLARTGEGKAGIKEFVQAAFGYDLNRRLADIRPGYKFDISCQGSVPEAIIAFLESEDFEDALRLAISLGGDSDTIACMAGAVAHAHYGVIPEQMIRITESLLHDKLKDMVAEFCATFSVVPQEKAADLTGQDF
jgi:ADP-ribosyl-[dinitrogen reductase] hydrolase